MRLAPDSPPDRDFRPVRGAPPLGLWGPQFGALWLNAVMLAVLALYPRADALFFPFKIQVALWALGLALAALTACHLRIVLHDLLTSLSDRDRFLLTLFMLGPILLPALVRGPRVVPDGPLWAAPAALLLAVTPWLTRRFLALTLIGAWLATMRMGHDPVALGLLLGFGISWLVALGASHFAATGDPHGLGGFWPVRKVVTSALAASIPAALAAVLAWWIWPDTMPAAAARGAERVAFAASRTPLIQRLDVVQWQALMWHLALLVVLVAAVIVLLHYLRKWLLRRTAKAGGISLIPGQVAQLEYENELPPSEKKSLPGLRGRIVQLWGRWAAAVERAGEGRLPGETAAAHAARLGRENPALTPPETMTALLERTHYGLAEPRREDVAAMERYVREQLELLKKRQLEKKREKKHAARGGEPDREAECMDERAAVSGNSLSAAPPQQGNSSTPQGSNSE